jgi:hypothetical protein
VDRGARRGCHRRRGALGEAVQLDPIKPKLKPPGTKRLKLKIDVLLSTSAFKFNPRRYSWGVWYSLTGVEFQNCELRTCDLEDLQVGSGQMF